MAGSRRSAFDPDRTLRGPIYRTLKIGKADAGRPRKMRLPTLQPVRLASAGG